MTIFNDHTSSSEEAEEMEKLKSGVEEAKKRIQDSREAPTIEDMFVTNKSKPKSKAKRK